MELDEIEWDEEIKRDEKEIKRKGRGDTIGKREKRKSRMRNREGNSNL